MARDGVGEIADEGAAVSQSLAIATSWPSENFRASWNAVLQASATSNNQTTSNVPNAHRKR